MEAWTAYLVGGGGFGLVIALIWKLIDATVKGVQIENERLGKRLKQIEVDYDTLLARTRLSEHDYTTLLAKHNELARQVSAAVPAVNL